MKLRLGLSLLVLTTIIFSSFAFTQVVPKQEGRSWLQEADASGSNKFAIWEDDTSGNGEILFRRSTDNGATWKAVLNLSNNPGDSYNPEMQVSGSKVYVVWTQETADGNTADIYFRRSLDNGASWGPKVKISSFGDSFDMHPQVASAGSNVFIVWQGVGGEDVENFLRRSSDSGATWKPLQFVGHVHCTPCEFQEPDVVASGANAYVIWQYDGEVRLLRSIDNGVTWKGEINLSTNTGNSYDAIIIASSSNVYVAWTQDNSAGTLTDILFRKSTNNGASWGPKVKISSSGEVAGAQFASSGSRLHIVWGESDFFGSYIKIRSSTDSGATWKKIVGVAELGDEQFTEAIMSPKIAASGANVYVTYMRGGHIGPDIFLKSSTDGGATWPNFVSPNEFSAEEGNWAEVPDIAAIGSSVFVVWQENVLDEDSEVHFRRSTNSGETWQSIINLSNNSGSSLDPQVGT